MNLCGDTLFQEWKTEKTDLYIPCRTLFMGIDLQRSGKQTCSDKTDLSASTGRADYDLAQMQPQLQFPV